MKHPSHPISLEGQVEWVASGDRSGDNCGVRGVQSESAPEGSLQPASPSPPRTRTRFSIPVLPSESSTPEVGEEFLV